jgi:hypothetical protein
MVSKRLTGTGDSSFAIYSQTPDIAKRLAIAITLADGVMAGTRANRACRTWIADLVGLASSQPEHGRGGASSRTPALHQQIIMVTSVSKQRD